MAEALAFEKDITIIVDSKEITKDIKLLLTFEEVGSGDFENVAWRVAEVYYDPINDQEVPVPFKSNLAFALASKEEGKYITSGKTVDMDLQQTIDVIMGPGEQLKFTKKIDHDDRLHTDQISAWNNADQEIGLSVGFKNQDGFAAVAYIGNLDNKFNWIATYKPNLRLYVTSDAKKGQVFDTIAKSDLIYEWQLANPSKVPQGSRWILTRDSTAKYVIKKA